MYLCIFNHLHQPQPCIQMDTYSALGQFQTHGDTQIYKENSGIFDFGGPQCVYLHLLSKCTLSLSQRLPGETVYECSQVGQKAFGHTLSWLA